MLSVGSPLTRNRLVAGRWFAARAPSEPFSSPTTNSRSTRFSPASRESLGGARASRRRSPSRRTRRGRRAVALEPRRNVRRHRVEVRRERHAAAGARRPDVCAALRDFLDGHVPAARDQPARDEIDRRPFGAGGGLEGEQLRSERDDIGHSAQVAEGEGEFHRRPRIFSLRTPDGSE